MQVSANGTEAENLANTPRCRRAMTVAKAKRQRRNPLFRVWEEFIIRAALLTLMEILPQIENGKGLAEAFITSL